MKIPIIYIIHYSKLSERKRYLEKRINLLGLSKYVEWVIQPLENAFSKKDLKKYNPSEEEILKRKKITNLKNISRLKKGEIFLVLNHIEALKRICKKREKIAMVAEDDIILEDHFPRRLIKVLNKLKDIEWDICYTDLGPMRKSRDSEPKLFEHPERIGNTTASYLINPNSAKKILDELTKSFVLGMDLELSYIQRKNELKVFWVLPPLTYQGSCHGIYSSSLGNVGINGIWGKFMMKVDSERYFSSFWNFLYKIRMLLKKAKDNFL